MVQPAFVAEFARIRVGPGKPELWRVRLPARKISKPLLGGCFPRRNCQILSWTRTMSHFLQALSSPRVLLMDGAMGTELQRAGLQPGECGALWNLNNPDQVRAV